MGSVVIRKRGNNEYAYYVHYDQNQRIEEYCGLISDAETRKRILRCEEAELVKQRERINQRLQKIRDDLM